MSKKREPKKPEDKRPIDMTSDELVNSVFPPDVVKRLKEIACGDEEEKSGYSLSQEDDSRSS